MRRLWENTPPTKNVFDMSKCKCNECAKEIEAGEPVFSVNEHDAIICIECYDELEKCASCGGRSAETEFEEISGQKYCDACFEDIVMCYSCDETVNTRRERYCIFDGEYYCRSCAEGSRAYDCDACSETISISEYSSSEGEDYVEEWLCYPCWERKGTSEHICEHTSCEIKRSVLDEHYWRSNPNSNESDKAAWAAHRDFFKQFYEFCLGDYNFNDFILRKGALGYGEYGWFKTEAKISTSINEQFCDFIYTLIRDDGLFTSHKRYGNVQPFAEAFQKHTVFQITSEGYEGKDKQSMWSYPLDDSKKALSFYVDYVARDQLLKSIEERKMPDGSALIKKVSKLIRANKDFIWKRYSRYRQTWREYKTNSITLKVPMHIGFDATVHKKVVAFNDDVASCQGREYRDTLGFNHISMQVNPHLYLLFYNPKNEQEIIGRAVVRLWYKRSRVVAAPHKDGWLDKSAVYVMPSRLYMKKYTHAKNDFYAAMFKGLNKWLPQIKHSLGVKEAILCAYKSSRHDSLSVYEYLQQAKNKDITYAVGDDSREQLASDWYYPIWEEKPNEEATWCYYADEYQGEQLADCESSASSRYALRETYSGNLAYIGVT